jgi:hypothetical protein
MDRVSVAYIAATVFSFSFFFFSSSAGSISPATTRIIYTYYYTGPNITTYTRYALHTLGVLYTIHRRVRRPADSPKASSFQPDKKYVYVYILQTYIYMRGAQLLKRYSIVFSSDGTKCAYSLILFKCITCIFGHLDTT